MLRREKAGVRITVFRNKLHSTGKRGLTGENEGVYRGDTDRLGAFKAALKPCAAGASVVSVFMLVRNETAGI